MIKALADQENGIPPIRNDRLTVAQYLKTWLAGKRPPAVRPRTYRYFEQMVTMYIVPNLGRRPLTELTPDAVQRNLDDLLRGGLAVSTVTHVRSVLHNALGDAVRLSLVHRNVVDLVRRLKQSNEQEEMQFLTAEQVQRFLAAAENDPHYALFLLAISTGMRPGELLALRWQNIDLEKRTLHVRATLNVPEILRTALGDSSDTERERGQDWIRDRDKMVFPPTKTRQSKRQIKLSAIAVETLLVHRARQNEQRLAAGRAWHNLDLVFANRVGHPLHEGNLVRRHLHPLLRKADLPQIRFYDLRHTAATLLLMEQINPKIVSEMLGHTTVAITLDRYSHALPDMQQDAAAAMDKILDYERQSRDA
jgi:integrase